MTENVRELRIRHQIIARGNRFIVRETFGRQRPIEFAAASYAEATALAAERRAFLLDMIAAISPEARKAVSEARTITTPTGHA